MVWELASSYHMSTRSDWCNQGLPGTRSATPVRPSVNSLAITACTPRSGLFSTWVSVKCKENRWQIRFNIFMLGLKTDFYWTRICVVVWMWPKTTSHTFTEKNIKIKFKSTFQKTYTGPKRKQDQFWKWKNLYIVCKWQINYLMVFM